MEIISVRDKRVKKLVEDPSLTAVKGLDAFMVKRIAEQIIGIRMMTHPAQLHDGFPNWRVHELVGHPGNWSLFVNGNWRLIFFCDVKLQQVSVLDLVDYH